MAKAFVLALKILLALAFSGCSTKLVRPDYDPGVTAADFGVGVNNPFMPLPVGAWWHYEAQDGADVETIHVVVLDDPYVVEGVTATAVQDTVTVNGVRVEAIDQAKVIDIGRTIVTPAGTFTDTITTEEWNPLEKGSHEYARYARGVGLIKKESKNGGGEDVLVAYHIPA